MRYGRVVEGVFVSRPNRFIAYADVGGTRVLAHVANTGRCRELLVPGSRAVLAASENPGRKTAYDLVAVWKGDRLVNIDSRAPNAVVGESIGKVLGRCDRVVPERTVGGSRFDFYAERGGRKVLLEVKGVTLEEGGHVLFPDAPTERGLKHVRELAALTDSYECWICFLVQMSGVGYMATNRRTHPEFCDACIDARRRGVRFVAYECSVTEDSLTLAGRVPVRLGIGKRDVS